ncbi:hypothetical protein CERZMDRAFT_87287 [Cercospora zeae-maydis SCOH1-5]|uniref:Uncharacterized protein n=1 Tax=Cercospora zeae-maydis SCOH1-5 TaxID=717836 RepID=A0A6A6F738_9PEZI|nr:hypothetical protein CERZMDRAFT_87287 [Cercospora zeae-maydis SCOH1-5]
MAIRVKNSAILQDRPRSCAPAGTRFLRDRFLLEPRAHRMSSEKGTHLPGSAYFPHWIMGAFDLSASVAQCVPATHCLFVLQMIALGCHLQGYSSTTKATSPLPARCNTGHVAEFENDLLAPAGTNDAIEAVV